MEVVVVEVQVEAFYRFDEHHHNLDIPIHKRTYSRPKNRVSDHVRK
jgi:hypothetical protein